MHTTFYFLMFRQPIETETDEMEDNVFRKYDRILCISALFTKMPHWTVLRWSSFEEIRIKLW